MTATRRPGPRHITVELVRLALSFIPPDVGHDERARIAFAVFDGLGEAGADAWMAWAAGRSKPDELADRATWRSAHKPGPVKVATLFGVAKDHGFRFPEADADAPAPDAEALARAAAERDRQRQREEAKYRERADRAARDARQLWADAREPVDTEPPAPYLQRKGVRAWGVRRLADGTLLVPVRDADGELQNLQRIAPALPSDGTSDKRFLPSGRKSGLWHLIGTPACADACTMTPGPAPQHVPVLLLAEGYATAASLHEATGWPVAVCFDAGNLKACAAALRGLHPDALFVVCGDDDRDTERRTRRNPGRVAAAAAVRAAVVPSAGLAVAVFPQGLPEDDADASDFNDLHRFAGLDAVGQLVRDAVARALAGLAGAGAGVGPGPGPGPGPGAGLHVGPGAGPEAGDASRPAPSSPETAPPWADPVPSDEVAPADRLDAPAADPRPTPGTDTKTSASPAPSSSKRSKRPGKSAPAGPERGDDAAPVSPDRYTVDDSGVWFTPPANDESASGARRVCDRLDVLALARDMQDRGGALLLQFDTAFGRGRRWLMPLSMLAGDGAEYRRELLDMGFHAPTDGNRRRWLTEYLQSRRPEERVRLVDRVGWHGKAYVLPRETLQAPAPDDDTTTDRPAPERLMFHTDAPADDTFRQRGDLAQWQAQIGRLCVGNSRLLFAVSAALAGPLLAWLPGSESGGFHLRGDSSSGKTTALRVAASIWGGADYLQRWRATDNGLEAQAAQHSDALLVLDELGQLDAKVAGESAYMLANGQGKARSNRNGGARPRLSWRLLWLSAGEIPLAQHMAEAGKRIRAGQELRMVDMPADAGAGRGVFEALHDHEGGAALSQHLAKACERLHGTPGRTWLEWLTRNAGTFHAELRAEIDALALAWVPEHADGQVQRAGRRFALVAAAGELATRQGLTGWPAGAASQGAKVCFLAWVNARPAGFGNSEQVEALAQVRRWFSLNGDALFTWWHRAMDDHKPNTALRAGFKRMVNDEGKPIRFDSATDLMDQTAKPGWRTGEGTLVEYMVFPEVFKSEVCKGMDMAFVARVLKTAGCLKHERDRLTFKHRLPGMGPVSVFHILPGVFDAGVDEE